MLEALHVQLFSLISLHSADIGMEARRVESLAQPMASESRICLVETHSRRPRAMGLVCEWNSLFQCYLHLFVRLGYLNEMLPR